MGTAVLTGASGFVGSHTASHLLMEGWNVRVLLRDRSSVEMVPDGCDTRRVDFLDEKSLAEAIEGCDAIIHAAGAVKAGSQEEFDRTNALVTAKLLNARERTEQGCRFVLVSSQAAAGPEGAGGPVTSYGRSKLLGEMTLQGRSNWVIVRPPAVFGPGDRASGPTFRAASKGLLVTPWTSGMFALVYAPDLADLLVRLTTADGVDGQTLEPSYGYCLTWQEFHEVLQRAAGRRILHIRVPPALVIAAAFASEIVSSVSGSCAFLTRDKCRELLAKSWAVEERKTTELTGWEPSMPLEDALRRTIQGRT